MRATPEGDAFGLGPLVSYLPLWHCRPSQCLSPGDNMCGPQGPRCILCIPVSVGLARLLWKLLNKYLLDLM